MWSILAFALYFPRFGAQAFETGAWTRMPFKIGGSQFTATFQNFTSGFDKDNAQHYKDARLLQSSSTEYQLAFYHHYPDNSTICFRYGTSQMNLNSVMGPLKYLDVEYGMIDAPGSMVYLDIFAAVNATTCAGGSSMIGGTVRVGLVTRLSNTVGYGVAESSSGSPQAGIVAHRPNGNPEIREGYMNLLLWNAGLDFDAGCSISLSVSTSVAFQYTNIPAALGLEMDFACTELPDSPVTVTWTCDGEQYTKDIPLADASCSGSSMQISLLGRKGSVSYPPVVEEFSGTADACSTTCNSVPDSSQRTTYGLVFYHYAPQDDMFICFKFGPSPFMWTTIGPLRYKDESYRSVEYSGSTIYLDIIAAESEAACGSSETSLVNGFQRGALVNSAQNTFGFSLQSGGRVGFDANRPLSSGQIEVVQADQVNLMFFNSAAGFNGSCDMRTNRGLELSGIPMGMGRELTDDCSGLPDSLALNFSCDGMNFTWESGSGGLHADMCAGSSQQFTLIGMKGSSDTPPEVVLLSGAHTSSGCETCAAHTTTPTPTRTRTPTPSPIPTSSSSCNTCLLSDVCMCIKESTISGFAISDHVDCTSGISFNPSDMVDAFGVQDAGNFFCELSRRVVDFCAMGCPTIIDQLGMPEQEGCPVYGICPTSTTTTTSSMTIDSPSSPLADLSISLTASPWLLFFCVHAGLGRA